VTSLSGLISPRESAIRITPPTPHRCAADQDGDHHRGTAVGGDPIPGQRHQPTGLVLLAGYSELLYATSATVTCGISAGCPLSPSAPRGRAHGQTGRPPPSPGHTDALIVVTATFLLEQLISGDPASFVLGSHTTPSQLSAFDASSAAPVAAGPVREPTVECSARNLGQSWISRQNVRHTIVTALPVTLSLAVLATVVTFILAWVWARWPPCAGVAGPTASSKAWPASAPACPTSGWPSCWCCSSPSTPTSSRPPATCRSPPLRDRGRRPWSCRWWPSRSAAGRRAPAGA